MNHDNLAGVPEPSDFEFEAADKKRHPCCYPNIKRILASVPRRALVVMNIEDAADGTLRLELHIRDTSRNRVLWAVKWRYDFDRAMHDLDCLIAKTEKE